MADYSEFINDCMYHFEKSNTIDGFYFSARLAGMQLVDAPGIIAETDCKGNIFLNMEELTKCFPDKKSQAFSQLFHI